MSHTNQNQKLQSTTNITHHSNPQQADPKTSVWPSQNLSLYSALNRTQCFITHQAEPNSLIGTNQNPTLQSTSNRTHVLSPHWPESNALVKEHQLFEFRKGRTQCFKAHQTEANDSLHRKRSLFLISTMQPASKKTHGFSPHLMEPSTFY